MSETQTQLSLQDCALFERLGQMLGDPSPERRAEAAQALSAELAHHGLSLGELVHHRREWGARPDLTRSCNSLVRHCAAEILPILDRKGGLDSAIEKLGMCRDLDMNQDPADLLRVIGIFAVGVAEILDPDTSEAKG